MKDNRLLQFLKKYWVIGVFALTALGAVFSSVEIYKEEVLNIDPDIKYEAQDTLYFAAERIDTLNPLISQSEDVYYLSKLLYSSLLRMTKISAPYRSLCAAIRSTQNALISI